VDIVTSIDAISPTAALGVIVPLHDTTASRETSETTTIGDLDLAAVICNPWL